MAAAQLLKSTHRTIAVSARISEESLWQHNWKTNPHFQTSPVSVVQISCTKVVTTKDRRQHTFLKQLFCDNFPFLILNSVSAYALDVKYGSVALPPNQKHYEEWTLSILNSRRDDQAVYECQVSGKGDRNAACAQYLNSCMQLGCFPSAHVSLQLHRSINRSRKLHRLCHFAGLDGAAANTQNVAGDRRCAKKLHVV